MPGPPCRLVIQIPPHGPQRPSPSRLHGSWRGETKLRHPRITGVAAPPSALRLGCGERIYWNWRKYKKKVGDSPFSAFTPVNHSNMEAKEHKQKRTKRAGREQVPRACMRCQDRKIKCDGRQPACGSCILARSSCFFPQRKREILEQ